MTITFASSPEMLLRQALEGGGRVEGGGASIPAPLLRDLVRGRLAGEAGDLTLPPFGIAVEDAIVEGDLELDNARGKDGGAVPALEFHRCVFNGRVSGRHGHFSRLTFSQCRFGPPPAAAPTDDADEAGGPGETSPAADEGPRPTIDLSGAQIETDLDMEGMAPAGDGDVLWVKAFGARIDGDLQLSRAQLRAPPGATYALEISLAEIKGDATFRNGFRAEGRVKGRGVRIEGDVWMSGATLSGRPEALFFQSAKVGGVMVLNGAADDGPDGRAEPLFEADGQVNLHQLRLGGNLYISEAKITGVPEPGAGPSEALAICLEGATISLGSIGPSDRIASQIHGQLLLSHLEVRSEIEIGDLFIGLDAPYGQETAAIDARSLIARQVMIRGVRPLPQAEGDDLDPPLQLLSVDLSDATVGKIEILNSHINGRFKASPLDCTGDVTFDARIGREMNLEGANIGGSLDISRLRMNRDATGMSLKDGEIARALRVAHRARPDEPQPDEIEEARVTTLTCLDETELIEVLWRYHSREGTNEVRQLAFLRHGDVIRQLDRRADTLREFIRSHGHGIRDEATAAEFARLYCAYGQSDDDSRWVLDAGGPLPTFTRWRPAGALDEDYRPLAELPPDLLEPTRTPRSEAPADGFAFRACLLRSGRITRGTFVVRVCGEEIRIAYRPDAQPEIEAIDSPAADGPYAAHPDGADPLYPEWVVPVVLRGSFRVPANKLKALRWRLAAHLRSDFSIHGTADLSDLSCDTLDDEAGRFWGRHVSLELDRFVYRQTTWAPEGRPPRLTSHARLDRWRSWIMVRWFPLGLVKRLGETERLRERTDFWEPWQIRRNWIYQQFETSRDLVCTSKYRIRRFEYRPHPFEQAARVARNEGRDDIAVEFETLRRDIDWQFFNRRARWALGRFGIIVASFFLVARREEIQPAGVVVVGCLAVLALMFGWRAFSGRSLWLRVVLMSVLFTLVVGAVFLLGKWDMKPLDFLVAAMIFTLIRFSSRLSGLSMRYMFGHLRRPVNALYTLFAAFLIGWAGVAVANREGMLVVDTAPVATTAAFETEKGKQRTVMVSPGSAVGLPFVHNVPCGGTISEPLYALDVLIPLIDLRQENRCEVSRAHHDLAPNQNRQPAARTLILPETPRPAIGERIADAWQRLQLQLAALPRKESFWLGLKAIYAIAGWLLVSLSILTFAHINRVQTEP